jgi:CheY-like chemotaxis protein
MMTLEKRPRKEGHYAHLRGINTDKKSLAQLFPVAMVEQVLHMKTNGVTRQICVLVVDDDPMVAQAARIMLEFLGHEVEVAKDANEGLDKAGKKRFDIVFTDYDMPGMKGDELALTLKRLDPERPVAMVTAYVDVLGDTPAVDMAISKPFMLQHLRDAISTLVPAPAPNNGDTQSN